MTWPNSLIDLPSSANFPNVRPTTTGRRRGNEKVEFQDYTKHVEGINVGYRYFTTSKKSVSYPFGFGANVEDIRATASYNLSKQHSVKCHDVMKPDM